MSQSNFLKIKASSITKMLRNIYSGATNDVDAPYVLALRCEIFKNIRSAIRATKFKMSDRVLASILMRDDGTFLNYRRPYDYSNGFLLPTLFILAQMEAIQIIVADLANRPGKPDWVLFYNRVEAKRKALIKEHKIK